MCEEKEKKCGVCKVPYFERNNYFYGKLMTVRDFFDEQCYFNEKRWLINRMVNGWGVVCGLDVKRKPVDPNDPCKGYDDTKVVVTPGLAIDCCGREILVCKEQEVSLIPEVPECHPGQQGQQGQRRRQQGPQQEQQEGKKKEDDCFIICLEYHECKTEPVNLPPIACDQKESFEFNRIRDGFKIYAKPKSECVQHPCGEICPLENKASFKITEQSLENLNSKGISDDVLKKLNEIINQEFIGEEEFLNAIGVTDEKCRSLIMKFAEKTSVAVHKYLCDKLKEGCPECPDCPCVILATVTLDQGGNIIELDTCSQRKLVYNNPMLYDLINCYHGDLPHVIGINWEENDEKISFEDFSNGIYQNGVKVKFDKKMNGKTINNNTFLFMVKMEEAETGNYRYDQVPGDVTYDDNEDGKPTATFKIESAWLVDVYLGHSRVREKGGEFMVVLRGDFILSDVSYECGRTAKALDGNFIGGKLPSGNGTQGGDFVSWFSVAPKPETKKESKKSR